jgi:uncharacterized membrane protein
VSSHNKSEKGFLIDIPIIVISLVCALLIIPIISCIPIPASDREIIFTVRDGLIGCSLALIFIPLIALALISGIKKHNKVKTVLKIVILFFIVFITFSAYSTGVAFTQKDIVKKSVFKATYINYDKVAYIKFGTGGKGSSSLYEVHLKNGEDLCYSYNIGTIENNYDILKSKIDSFVTSKGLYDDFNEKLKGKINLKIID